MTAEHLLDAMGLLDDDLIADAEKPIARRKPLPWRGWVALAACVVLVAALGRMAGLTDFSSGNSASGGVAGGENAGGGVPHASGSSGGGFWNPDGNAGGANDPVPDSNGGSSSQALELYVLAEGGLYRSTGQLLVGEPDPEAIRISYSLQDQDSLPLEDESLNILSDASYVVVDQGLAVLVDHEWVLFKPVS